MQCPIHHRYYDYEDCCPRCADEAIEPAPWRHSLVVDLSAHTLTWHLERFRALIEGEAQRLAREDGITLHADVTAMVLTTLDVLSTATHARQH
jgi:hypothetical protein